MHSPPSRLALRSLLGRAILLKSIDTHSARSSADLVTLDPSTQRSSLVIDEAVPLSHTGHLALLGLEL